MLTDEDQVKILDFGLAKLLEPEPASGTDLDTISRELTRAGRVWGTAAHMSPEQARGQRVDSRSDLFSFGIVLHELVTGKLPFAGPTAMDTLTAIIHSRPANAIESNPTVPAELERILGKCLEKEPRDRYQDTRDLVVDLRRLGRETDSQPLQRLGDTVPQPRAAERPRRSALTWAVPAVIVVLAALVFGLQPLLERQAESTAPLSPRQLIANPVDFSIEGLSVTADGTRLVFLNRIPSNNSERG